MKLRRPQVPHFEPTLIARGLLPVRQSSARELFRRLDIPIEHHQQPRILSPNEVWVGVWSPCWAVWIADCDPLSEAARMWALKHARDNEGFRTQLETIMRVALKQPRSDASMPYRKLAEYINQVWTP